MSSTYDYIRSAVHAAVNEEAYGLARDLLQALIDESGHPFLIHRPTRQSLAEEQLETSGADYTVRYEEPFVTPEMLDEETSAPEPEPELEPTTSALSTRRRRLQHNKAFWAIFIEDNYIPYLVNQGLNSFRVYDLLQWIKDETSVLNPLDKELDASNRESWRARVSHSLGDLVMDGILKRNHRNGQHYMVMRFKTESLVKGTPHHPV